MLNKASILFFYYEVENTCFFYLSFQAFYASKSRQIPEDNSTHIIKGFNDGLRSRKRLKLSTEFFQ